MVCTLSPTVALIGSAETLLRIHVGATAVAPKTIGVVLQTQPVPGLVASQAARVTSPPLGPKVRLTPPEAPEMRLITTLALPVSWSDGLLMVAPLLSSRMMYQSTSTGANVEVLVTVNC